MGSAYTKMLLFIISFVHHFEIALLYAYLLLKLIYSGYFEELVQAMKKCGGLTIALILVLVCEHGCQGSP